MISERKSAAFFPLEKAVWNWTQKPLLAFFNYMQGTAICNFIFSRKSVTQLGAMSFLWQGNLIVTRLSKVAFKDFREMNFNNT